MVEELNELLDEVNSLFKIREIRKGADAYSFTLGRFGRGFWVFNVVDSWHNWIDKDYDIHFTGDTPQEAVGNFLRYIKNNNINVEELMEK